MQKKGFTLIELLVVIAIIGILAAIGVTAFGGAQSKARDSKRKADLGGLAASLTIWIDTNNVFPISRGDGGAACTAGAGTAGLVQRLNCTTPAAAAGNLLNASGDATNGFTLPTPPNYIIGTPDESDYWYITTATGDHYALFTRMESVTNAWFVVNDRGYSNVVTDATANASTAAKIYAATGANDVGTTCTLGVGTGAYEPCKPNVASADMNTP